MRLWHEALIPYLPRQQLLGQHRECCALRGLGWGKPHSVVNYVFEHPRAYLMAYHFSVMIEMENRGYKVDSSWKDVRYRGKKCSPEMDHPDALLAMVNAVLELRHCTGNPVYPEHNEEYLLECLDNLAGKGIHIEMEVQNASDL